MYGMVNRGIRDLVLAERGANAWAEICERAGLDSTEFNDSTNYDDAVTYDLVAAVSSSFGWTSEEVLIAFGRHWVLFTGQEGWGSLFDMAGDDMRSFVAGLDDLHARVQASMPRSVMPSFAVVPNGEGWLDVEYRSARPGLGPMVIGLFQGLAEHFGENWTIEHRGRLADDQGEHFRLQAVVIEDQVDAASA